jgi:hypothetical protein
MRQSPRLGSATDKTHASFLLSGGLLDRATKAQSVSSPTLLTPILLGLSLHCGRIRVLHLQPIPRTKPILERVRELQAIAATKAAETPEKLAGELNQVLAAANEDKAHSAAVSAILGKAKVLGLEAPTKTEMGKPGDYSQAKSTADIGRMLLAQVGHAEPSESDIEQAIAANEQFIETLQAIRDRALGSNVPSPCTKPA